MPKYISILTEEVFLYHPIFFILVSIFLKFKNIAPFVSLFACDVRRLLYWLSGLSGFSGILFVRFHVGECVGYFAVLCG